ncbi:nitroreductase/quinone reductase family protein [Salinibacterium sp. ZJ454]|uniref:nitroreductase/quinone reductase family protein n=1 Tax=Salinibacterium sp. ZJ454 TaxID=2708339 RepID=UPI001421DD95|nr:nitroreductase/quinone reductase family protein [Salinibacterium sp. ZJ454]
MTIGRRLRRAAGALNNAIYRATGGRLLGRMGGLSVLLLTVPGRKTGLPHTTAVSYIMDAHRFVVTGSAGGSAKEPQWFRNLRHADQAVIEVGPRRITVTVTIAGPSERARLWHQLTSRAPFFDRYQAKVDRLIPMAILSPVR